MNKRMEADLELEIHIIANMTIQRLGETGMRQRSRHLGEINFYRIPDNNEDTVLILINTSNIQVLLSHTLTDW